MLDSVGRYNFLVEPFHCDFSHHVFMGHLGNMMLNVSDFHSNDRGFGMNELNPQGRTWVVSRLVIEMERMPEAYDTIAIDTWVESVRRYFTARNYAVTDGAGRKCGYGRSVWAMIDTATRQPVDITTACDGLVVDYADASMECPIEQPSRVKMGDKAKLVRTIDTHYSDVDVNGHVNSVKYIEHILDLWEIGWYEKYYLQRLDIAYVAETYAGDRLDFYVEPTDNGCFNVRVAKTLRRTDESVETCRCRLKFVKK